MLYAKPVSYLRQGPADLLLAFVRRIAPKLLLVPIAGCLSSLPRPSSRGGNSKWTPKHAQEAPNMDARAHRLPPLLSTNSTRKRNGRPLRAKKEVRGRPASRRAAAGPGTPASSRLDSAAPRFSAGGSPASQCPW